MKLIRANINDCEKIWKMQKEAFTDLLEKYQDYETSPANEPVEKIKAKLQNGEGGDSGETIVQVGTPEKIIKNEKSYTGKFLKPFIEK